MNISITLPKQDNKVLNFIVFILFFFSGMSGLIYQIVWTRMLVLIFGNTLLATSTVLSAFMAGLAAGSYVFGKFADKRPRGLLRVFALLEAGVGVYALIFPLLLSVVGPLYTILYQSLAGSLAAINLIRFGICFVLIVVPTFLMGATLPVLIKRFVKGTQTIGRHVGLLYGLNTTGAVVGSVICGFLFLKLPGMHLATLVAVGINLLVALLAWVLGKENINPNEPGKDPDKKLNVIKDKTETLPQEYSSAAVKAVLIGIGISGFCALAYELFWTRMLNLFFHNTVYSFTTILAAFLTGIALGSLIYSKFLSGIANKVRLFIIVEIGIGFFAYITPFIFNMLYDPVFSKSAGIYTILQAVVIMIAPTILMGIALPLAVQICQRGPKREGDSVGTVYAVNTIGSILGAFMAGFVFLPHLGIQKSVAVVVCFNLFAALLALISTSRNWFRWFYGFSFPGLLVILIIIAPTTIFRSLYQEKQSTADLAYYKEGKIANVVVYDFYKNGYKDLYLNGLEEASSRLWHVQFFKMLGTLPVVAHAQPDDALMIGFGAGMSAGACIDLVNHFECAELNHDIFEEANFFKEQNRDVIHNPKLNMIFNDGRNYLLLAPKKYSLIISDATNPLTFDSWTLYTKEFYELCKQKLKPNGVFCQWVPIPLPKDAIKVILKTFKTVFPHTSLWGIYGCSQYLMLATPERLKIDYRELTKKLPRVLKTSGLTEYGVDTPDKFLSFFLLGEDQLDKYLQGFATINTDDLPGAQFHAGINREGMQTSLEMLKYQETIEPYLTNLGEEKDRLQASLKNYLSISRLLNLGFLLDKKLIYKKALVFAANVNRADDQNILYMLDYGPMHKEYFLERVNRYPGDANAHNSMGYIYWKEGNYKDAISEFQQAITLNPDFVNARVNLAQTYIDASLYDQGVEELLAVVDMNPTLDILNMTRAELRIVHFLQKLRYHKNDPKLYIQLGNTYAEREEINEAIQAYNQAAELQNNDPNILTALALLYESVDLVDKSLEYLERLAQAFPGDVNLQEKIKELHAIQIDEQARENWISEQITPKKEPTVHFPGCDRAAKKWNEFDFEGKISPQNLREAAAEFEKVIKIEKRHMHAYADAAAIYEYLKEYGKAADLWRQGLQVSPGNQIAANNIQRLMLLEELTYRNPSFQRRVSLYNDIGVLYWKNGEIERAIHYFKKAVSDQPDHAMAWANLGANYIEAGKYPEALQVIEYALKLSPDIEFGKQMQARLQWLKELLRGVNNEG
jgi:spermidine synthase